MAFMVTSCSTATLAAKSVLLILHLKHRDFKSVFARKYYEQMVVFIQSRSFELY